MKISYNWLKEFIPQLPEPQKLSEILVNLGLEVENIEKYETVKNNLKGVVIGQVVEKEKHPNADKLSITKVNIGGDKLLNIVCGAPNVEKGQKVFVATLGTELFFKDKPFKISLTKIRGIESEGMICAEDELGLGNSHDGIIVLPDDAPVGLPAATYLKLEEDIIFEIGLTPNRSDATSHYGIARDLIAYFNSQLNNNISLPSLPENIKIDNTNYQIDITVEDTKGCGRYTGIVISNVTIKESPQWLKRKLLSIGQTPINNVVDITNYILHSYGQPLHAFDADKITNRKIIVRKNKPGEEFVTLDNVKRVLNNDDLMICDAEKPMCMAGIYGGIDSGITEDTKNIFLESAYFNPEYIRRSSKHHNLKTDAAFRFERGTDPAFTRKAIVKAASMIKEFCGGTISSEIIDIININFFNEVSLNINNVNKVIGNNISKEKIINILNGLEIKILEDNNNTLKLSVPLYRYDVIREIDVIEEICRIYGYNNVSIPDTLSFEIGKIFDTTKHQVTEKISYYLVNNGFYEIQNNSISNLSIYEKFNDNIDRIIRLSNPLSDKHNILRMNLLYGGLETILYNINRKNNNLKLFEFGKIYQTVNNKQKYNEENILAILATGKKNKPSWLEKPTNIDFFFLKKHIEGILILLDCNKTTNIIEIEDTHLNPAIIISINNVNVAKIGNVRKTYLDTFDISQEVFYAELYLEKIIEIIKNKSIIYEPLPKYPSVRRDIAILIDKNIKYSEIEKVVRDCEKELITDITLFDFYEGNNIEKDKKSYAFTIILQDKTKTLTDKETDNIVKKIHKQLESTFNAKIR